MWDTGDHLPDGLIAHHEAPIIEMARAPLATGETTEVWIYPISPKSWGRLPIGHQLRMCEGGRQVGRARVVSIEQDWKLPWESLEGDRPGVDPTVEAQALARLRRALEDYVRRKSASDNIE
jgi:hypothetical protein